jgi:hypothetical protein
MSCHPRPRWEFHDLAHTAVKAATELDNQRLGKVQTMEASHELASEIEAFAVAREPTAELPIPDDPMLVVFYARLMAMGGQDTVEMVKEKLRAVAARLRKDERDDDLRDLCVAFSRQALAWSRPSERYSYFG